MSTVIGRINSIETLGALDGPGIRTVIFLQGCPFKCGYCHNPDTWDTNGGKEYSSNEIFQKILRYVPYYKQYGGVTLSGGEPLLQADFAVEILRLCKENGITTTLDTSGALFNDKIKNLLQYVDLVMADVKALDEESFKETCGGSFHTFIKFLDYCQSIDKPVWLRQVVIGGVNDSEEKILQLKKFAAGYNNVQKIQLLSYHTEGLAKWLALGWDYPLKYATIPTEEKMLALRALLK